MRILIFFGKLILTFIVSVLIIWLILLGMLQTKTGQDFVYHSIIGYFERTTHTQIQVEKFTFSFPLSLGLEDVTFSQDNQPILSIKKIELCCNYTNLLQGRLVCSCLRADHIHVNDIPSFFASLNKTQLTTSTWETPPIPFYVKIENVDIQKLTFNSKVFKSLNLSTEINSIIEKSNFNLNGMISNNPFKSALTAHLLLTAKSNQTDSTLFSLGIGTQKHQLSLSFHSNRLPLSLMNGELAPSTAESRLKGHFALYASAPVSTWQNLAEKGKSPTEPIEGHFKVTLNTINLETDVIGDKNENLADFIPTLIGKQTVLRAHYLINSTQAIEFANVKIDNPYLSLIGEGILYSNKTIDQGRFQGKINNLAFFQPWIKKNLQGSLTFEGDLLGELLSPHVALYLTSPQLLITNHSFQNIHSTMNVNPENKNLHGFFDLAFSYEGAQWKTASLFDWNNTHEILTFSQLQVEGPGSQLNGEVTFSTSDFIGEGWLQAQVDDLNDFSQFLTIPLKGEGKLKLELMGIPKSENKRQQAIKAEFIGHALQWKDWETKQLFLDLNLDPTIEDPSIFQVRGSLNGEQLKERDYFLGQYAAQFSHQINFKQSTLQHLSAKWEAEEMKWPDGSALKGAGKIESANPSQVLEGTFDFIANDVKTSSIELQELMGSTHVDPYQEKHPFQLNGRGFWKEDLFFALDGNWNYHNEEMKVEAQQLTGRLGPYPFQLKQPLHIRHHHDDIQVSELWFQWGEGEIQGDFHLANQHISSQFKTNDIPSELLYFIAPSLPLSGRATFQGQIEGPLHVPTGHLDIDLHQIQIIENVFAQKPFIAGKINLTFDEKGVLLQSELNGIGETPLLIDGKLPIDFNLAPMALRLNSDLPFNVNLNAEGELDPYLHLFYNDTTNLSGQAKIALNVSGQLDAPQIKGHIDLINGAFESLSTGALYHNIQAHLEGDGSKIVLTQLSAQDNKNGQISATGTIHLDASQQFPFEFDIQPSRIFILDSDYIDISASGKLHLAGNTQKSKLEGELNIEQASVHLEEALPQSIKKIDIKYINTLENDPLLRFIEKRDTHFPIDLNVKLNAPQNITVEGKNLKSEWKGSLVATGTVDNLQLNGDVRLTFGEYNFNGKVFNLTQGNIHFGGSLDKKTTLYIVASKEMDRITAEIIIKGAVDKPVVSFRSNPPLSQREVLSYILFNRGISDITQDQGDQLSQSFISLNTSEQASSSDDFLSRLRNNIGIDRLDFTSNDNKENKEFGLQVGKHITENILISVKQGMVSLSPIIAVEAKLHKNIKAQAEVGIRQSSMEQDSTPIRMSIKWKKDY